MRRVMYSTQYTNPPDVCADRAIQQVQYQTCENGTLSARFPFDPHMFEDSQVALLKEHISGVEEGAKTTGIRMLEQCCFKSVDVAPAGSRANTTQAPASTAAAPAAMACRERSLPHVLGKLLRHKAADVRAECSRMCAEDCRCTSISWKVPTVGGGDSGNSDGGGSGGMCFLYSDPGILDFAHEVEVGDFHTFEWADAAEKVHALEYDFCWKPRGPGACDALGEQEGDSGNVVSPGAAFIIVQVAGCTPMHDAPEECNDLRQGYTEKYAAFYTEMAVLVNQVDMINEVRELQEEHEKGTMSFGAATGQCILSRPAVQPVCAPCNVYGTKPPFNGLKTPVDVVHVIETKRGVRSHPV